MLGNAVRKVGDSARKHRPFLNQHHAPQVSPVLSTLQNVRPSPPQRPWETRLPGQVQCSGLMLYTQPFQEEMALQVAYAYEQATDWHRRSLTLS